MHAHACTHTPAHACARMHMCTHIHMPAHTCTWMHTPAHIHLYTHACTHTHVHAPAHIHTCTRKHMHTCTRLCTCTCLHTPALPGLSRNTKQASVRAPAPPPNGTATDRTPKVQVKPVKAPGAPNRLASSQKACQGDRLPLKGTEPGGGDNVGEAGRSLGNGTQAWPADPGHRDGQCQLVPQGWGLSCHEGAAAGPHHGLPNAGPSLEDGFPWRVGASGPGGRHEARVDTQDPTRPPHSTPGFHPAHPPAETRGR